MGRSILRRYLDHLRAEALKDEIRRGKKKWGRQPEQAVKMPARATISAVVIRADGTRENLGVLHESQIVVTQEQLDHFDGSN